jgi:hypothetical protein
MICSPAGPQSETPENTAAAAAAAANVCLLAGAMGAGGSASEGKCCRAPIITDEGGSCSVGSGVCW